MIHYIKYNLSHPGNWVLEANILTYNYCDISKIPFYAFTTFEVKEIRSYLLCGDSGDSHLMINSTNIDEFFKSKIGQCINLGVPSDKFYKVLLPHLRDFKLKEILIG
jgi:hypothetical protein